MNTTAQQHPISGLRAESRSARKPLAIELRTTAPSPAREVTRERIEARAFEIFQARGRNGDPGDALSDWLQAEREISGSALSALAAADVESKDRARGETLLASIE